MHELTVFLYIVNFLLVLTVIFIEQKNPVETILWICLLFAFPVIGFLLYIFLGMTLKFKMQKLILTKKLKNVHRSLFYKQLNDAKDNEVFQTQSTAKNLIMFNLNYSNSVLIVNNEADIILSGDEKYKMLFEDINNAKQYIHAQYFLIHDDVIGNRFIECLTKKAKEGIKIKLLYDALSNISTPLRIFYPLITAGGEVKKLKSYFTHYRNHRKIVVIDGLIGYTGGMNIGDEYANLKENQPLYRDTHIRLAGDVVYMLQYYFLRDWFYISKPKGSDIGNNNIMRYFPNHCVNNHLPCQVVACGSNYDCKHIKMGFLKMIYSAKQRILIQSPYFIPNESIMQALIIAALSGVKIELMIPSKTKFIITVTNNYYVDRIIKYGIKVFLYNGYIHSKTLSADGVATSIGTANMDYRSMDTDDELTIFFYDEHFTKLHESIFDNDKKNCYELDYDKFNKRNIFKKTLEKLCRLFAPLM